jgi:hypothetical protein
MLHQLRKASGLILVSCLVAMAQVGSVWKIPRNGFTNPFNALIPHGDGFLGVGSDGLIAGTPDGAAWAAYPSGTMAELNFLIQGGNLFVSGGDSGAVVTSPNGIDWTRRTGTYRHPLISGAYGNGTYVLLGNDKTILTSTDGLAWTPQSIASASILYSCAFGDGRFIVAGEAGTIYDSPDGKTWTLRPKAAFSIYSIVRGDSEFVARDANNSYHSKDGLTWTKGGALNGYYDISFADKRFLCAGPTGAIYTSTDGVNWSMDTTGTHKQLYCIAASGGRTLASGVEMTFSPGGKTWATRTFDATRNLKSVAYGNGRYVAVGDWDAMQISTDGTLWSSSVGKVGNLYTKVIFADGKFTALGSEKSIVTSVDGDNWTVALPQVIPYTFTDVAFGNSGFVAIGNTFDTFSSKSIAYGSTHGATWASLAANMITVRAMAYGGDKYVAVGYNGTVLSSADGIKWESRAVPGFTRYLFSIAYGGGGFVAVGERGGIISSPDGITWTNRTTDSTTSFSSVTYNGHQYVAIGSGSALRVSTDGATWTKGTSPVGVGDAIYFGGGRHIMLGVPGGLAVSTDSIITTGIRDVKFHNSVKRWGVRCEDGMLRLNLPDDFIPAKTELRVLDVRGRERLLRRYPVGLPAEGIAVSDLPGGMYVVEIRGGLPDRTLVGEFIR